MTRTEFYAICTEATVNPFLVLEDEAARDILRQAKATDPDQTSQQQHMERLRQYLAETY